MLTCFVFCYVRDLYIRGDVNTTKVNTWLRNGAGFTTDFADSAILGLGIALLDLTGLADVNTRYDADNATRKRALETLAPYHRG